MTSGIRPVFVFDGKPPQLKGGELGKCLARRARAEADLAVATAAEEVEDMEKFSRRLTKVTRQHNEDCQELLRLMGIPYIIAPCEAEAQCAELARKQKVYGTATEDMDALTFRTPKLIRKLTFSQASKEKQPIVEIDFEVMLRGLELTYEQFVDLCILCGCDYCSTIKGIGPKTALKLIKQYKTLEQVIKVVKSEKKFTIPLDWFPIKIKKEIEGETKEKEGEEEGEEGDIEENEEEIDDERDEDMEGEEHLDEDMHLKDAAIAATSSSSTEDKGENEGKEATETMMVDEPTSQQPQQQQDVVEAKTNDDNNDHAHTEEEIEYAEPLFAQARKLFVNCEVLDAESVELKWTEPNEIGLKAFLIDRMGFNEDRVLNAIKKLKEAQQQKSQKRVDR
jgi:flap endonuclease-1